MMATPTEFGAQLAALHTANAQISVLGGCCATDARHIAAIAAAQRADSRSAQRSRTRRNLSA